MFSINYKPSQRKDQAADRERNAAAERRRIAQAQAQQAVRDKKELEEELEAEMKKNAIGCPWICFCVSLVLVGGVSIWLSEIEIGMAEDLVRALGSVDLP